MDLLEVALGELGKLPDEVSGLIDEINQDDEVTFELSEGRKGLNAVDVKLDNE